MAPGTRRANRGGYVEHDDFEGLPVRQWRQEWTNIAPPPQPELHQNDVWAIELLHGMPKDAILLPPHTQELLRAARSGRLYKRPPPTEDDDADGDTVQPDKLDKKEEEDAMSQGYHVRLWRQIPKNVEAPVISHLAKRRKNTVTIASRTLEEKVQGPTVTRATVRRIDAAGNPYTEEVTLAEGQQLDGEIISTRVEAVPVAKVEAAAPALTPARRRPPPPKRKSKAGPGRGKKKLKNMPVGGQPVGSVVTRASAPAIKPETSDQDVTLSQIRSVTPTHESEIAEGDDDDDDEEGEDGEEGEEGEEGEAEADETTHIENLHNASTMTADTSTASIQDDNHDATGIDVTVEVEMEDSFTVDETTLGVSSSPSQRHALAPPHPSPNAPLEGSPLRNVVVQSPIETSVSLPPPVTADSEPETTHTAMDLDLDMTEPPAQQQEQQEQQAEEPRPELPEDRNLLPPPPDQVGNISSPRTDDGAKSQASHEVEEGEGGGSSHRVHQMPTVTEDIIKPEDSVSVTAPMLGSAAPSEVGTTSLDDFKAGPLSISGDVPFHIESETLVEVEGESEGEAAVQTEADPETIDHMQVEEQVEGGQDIGPELEDVSKAEAEAEAEAEVEVEVEASAQVEAQAGDEPQPETQDERQAQVQDEIQAEAQDKLEAEAQAQDEFQVEAQDELEAEAHDEIQAEAHDEIQADVQVKDYVDVQDDETPAEVKNEAEAVVTLALEQEEGATPNEEEHNLLSSLLGELDRQDGEAAAKQEAQEAARVEPAQEEEAVMTELQAALHTEPEEGVQEELLEITEEVLPQAEAPPENAQDEVMAEVEAPPAEVEAEASRVIEPVAGMEAPTETVIEVTSTEKELDAPANA